MSTVHSQITLAGQRFNVSRDEHGRCFIGDETAAEFVERMVLLQCHDILADLTQIGMSVQDRTLMLGSPQATAWSLHQNRRRAN